MAGTIMVGLEKYFQYLDKYFPNRDGTKLHGSFLDRCDSSKLIEQLQIVLAPFKAKYESVLDDNPREIRKVWRDERITLYDNLLCLALNAAGDDLDLWFKNGSPTELFFKAALSNLIAGSVYTYLLDQIHEDEEIMFKFYRTDNGLEKPFEWRKKALWLVKSIRTYRQHLFYGVVGVMCRWDDENEELCKQLVTQAKEKFEKTLVSLHGRNFKSERNWRNRARLYWLLGLARHGSFDGPRKFKKLEYEGLIGRLVREMIQEDEDMLSEESTDPPLLRFCKAKNDKVEKNLLLGHIEIGRLLAWASAADDLELVSTVLRHNCAYLKPEERNYKWKESWKESWAMALWNAVYKGNAKVVNELLKCEYSDYGHCSEYFNNKKMEPPLHVAVRRGHVSVVNQFCTLTSLDFSCHKGNANHQTPLELATNLENPDTKRRMLSVLFQRQEVKDSVQELSTQRELILGSANAIMVGATLIASITFGGWLQPPLGFSSYYQFAEPQPAPPDSYESYMSIEGHTSIEVFAIFNSLSFFIAIAAIVAGMETTYFNEAHEVRYISITVKSLQPKLKLTKDLFICSVMCVLVAFASAGIAILPPIKHYQRNMYITIGIGGTICVAFIGKMFWFCIPGTICNFVVYPIKHLSSMLKSKFQNSTSKKFHPRMSNKKPGFLYGEDLNQIEPIVAQ